MTAHAIPDSLESTIRGHLREITSEEVAIRDISPMTDDVDRFGRPFTARERLRGILEGRLRGVRLHSPTDQALQRTVESSLAALAAMAPDEQLYSWTAKAAIGYVSGISTVRRSISSAPATLITTQSSNDLLAFTSPSVTQPSNHSLRVISGRSDDPHGIMKTPPFQSTLALTSGS